MFTSVGRLRYGRSTWNLVVDVDPQLTAYYRALLPKAWYPQPPKYPAHISVLRREIPVNLELWNQYDGEAIEFFYVPEVRIGQVYYWLDVYCSRLEDIRLELGLPLANLYEPALPGFRKRFHCTIANIKDQVANGNINTANSVVPKQLHAERLVGVSDNHNRY